MIELNKEFWNNRYKEGATGWDIGYVSTPIKEFIDQIESKSCKILIPGAGNSYEAEYLFNSGFKNVWVLDIAREAIQNFKKRVPGLPQDQILEENFFDHQGTYDLIIEQTFFCALNPKLREEYCLHMNNLLKTNGKLVGVLFNQYFDQNKPPFGGKLGDYKPIFEKFLDLKKMEICYNSIPPRSGKELFFVAQKR